MGVKLVQSPPVLFPLVHEGSEPGLALLAFCIFLCKGKNWLEQPVILGERGGAGSFDA